MFCAEIDEKTLELVGMPQFVDMVDEHYNAMNCIRVKLRKRGISKMGLDFGG